MKANHNNLLVYIILYITIRLLKNSWWRIALDTLSDGLVPINPSRQKSPPIFIHKYKGLYIKPIG